MSQSPARAARRECKRHGHVPKTGSDGSWHCWRCGVSVEAPPRDTNQEA